MTTASQDKITVPGDDRLTKLNVSTKTPFWTKIPIIKDCLLYTSDAADE